MSPSERDLFIITSKIVVSNSPLNYCANRSIYTVEERLSQTLKTIESIHVRAPNADILLIDDSAFDPGITALLENSVDMFLGRTNISDITQFTDMDTEKGMGEAAQIIEALKYLTTRKTLYGKIFKISGRYLLNDKFHSNNFHKSGFIFKSAREFMRVVPHLKNYFYTSLFKFEYSQLHMFLNILMEYIALDNKMHYEQDIPKLVKQYTTLHTIETLGLEQNISVWKKTQYLYQLNI